MFFTKSVIFIYSDFSFWVSFINGYRYCLLLIFFHFICYQTFRFFIYFLFIYVYFVCYLSIWIVFHIMFYKYISRLFYHLIIYMYFLLVLIFHLLLSFLTFLFIFCLFCLLSFYWSFFLFLFLIFFIISVCFFPCFVSWRYFSFSLKNERYFVYYDFVWYFLRFKFVWPLIFCCCYKMQDSQLWKTGGFIFSYVHNFAKK